MRSAAAPAARCRSTGRNRPSVRSRSAMVREEVDQERDRAARAALLCATQVSDTGYVEVRPAQAFGELGQETGCRDGTAFAAAGIGEVREIALELLVVLLGHRHMPGAIFRPLTGSKDFRRERVVVAHDRCEVCAERNHAGAG